MENTNVDVIVDATNENKEVEEVTRKRKGVEGEESSEEEEVSFTNFIDDETKKRTNPYSYKNDEENKNKRQNKYR